ncbi:hypothetical protein LINGRAHAP2_LOCUS20573, partial [Linum grandiflorum]
FRDPEFQTCPSFLTYLDRLVFAQGSSKCSYFPFPSQYRDLWRSPECEEGGRSCHCETKEMKMCVAGYQELRSITGVSVAKRELFGT